VSKKNKKNYQRSQSANKTSANKQTKTTNKWNKGLTALLIGIVCIVLIVVGVVLVCNKPAEEQPNLVTNAATPSEYSAQTYLIDSWHENFDDGTKKHYITLAIYSADYYAEIDHEDIKYLDEGKYESLSNVWNGSSVEIFNLNTTQSGICAYAKITTNELIDLKKIYVKMSGPAKYDAEALTKDDYVEKYGTTDGWCSKLASVSERSIPHRAMFAMQGGLAASTIRLYTEEADMYYYESTKEPVIDGNSIMTKFNVNILKECSIDTLVDVIAYQTTFANIVDGVALETELDERLQIVAEIVDGEVWIGFETVDGSAMSTYNGEVPDAIVHKYNGKTSYFVIK
jgi:hypothetical protein